MIGMISRLSRLASNGRGVPSPGSSRNTSALKWLALSALCASGCIVPNENHCVNRGGDEACADGLKCSNGTCSDLEGMQPLDGCVNMDALEAGCACPNGRDDANCGTVGAETGSETSESESESGTSEAEASETGDGDGDGDGDATGDGDGDTGPQCSMQGLDTQDCSGDAAWCVDGSCVDCAATGAGACTELSADTPVCDAGVCVQCTAAEAEACEGVTPVCDEDTNGCVACTQHAECGEAGCNFSTGACLDAARVWWVDGDGGADGNDGSEGMPFATIGRAMMEIGAGTEGTVRVLAVVGAYTEQVLVNQARTVALLGEGTPWIQSQVDSGVALSSGTVTFLDGIRVASSAQDGVNCNGATAWLDNMVIEGNSSAGIRAVTGCTAVVRNSMISGHTSIAGTGSEIANGGDLTLSYTTVLGTGTSGVADVLVCTAGTFSATNSIFIGAATDKISCPGASIENSATNDSEFTSGTNVDAGVFTPTFFVNANTGDLHLANGGTGTPFGGVSSLQADDLGTDIDGDTRPAMGFVGADEP